MSGWGGAGAFSDGKLTLTTEYGGWLDQFIGKDKLKKLINYVDEIYLEFGATSVTYGRDSDIVASIAQKAQHFNLKLIPAEIRHLGTEKNLEILKKMRQYLGSRIDIRPLTTVERIIQMDEKLQGVELASGEKIKARYVISGPGRQGAEWFQRESKRLGLTLLNNMVDIGVRVEVSNKSVEHITKHIYESKLVYRTPTFNDTIRTFCMNPGGEVVLENTDGLITVNGHSYSDPSKRTENTNFALLVSQQFTEPFDEPLSYGRSIARLANMLGKGALVQRLGDLRRGRRSTSQRIAQGGLRVTLMSATPGDLSLALPHRYIVDIVEMLQAMDKIAPGVGSDDTLLYGVEVKFYSSRLKLTNSLETEIPNLFAIGDGAGVTRGLAQASTSGIIVAREIIRREK